MEFIGRLHPLVVHLPIGILLIAFIFEVLSRFRGYKKLKGRDGFRIRVADYRIIYDIFDNILQVDVIDLGHRKEVYE